MMKLTGPSPTQRRWRVERVPAKRARVHWPEHGVMQGDLSEKRGRYAACGTRATYVHISDDPMCVTCKRCLRYLS